MESVRTFLDLQIFGTTYRQCPEKMVGKFAGKRLVVVGGGRCVWDDLARLGVRGDEHQDGRDIMVVNDITMHMPGRVLHAYSNDHRWLPKWLEARRELITRKYGPIEYVHSCRTGAKYNWPWPGHGSSSLGAVYTGLAMGYDSIVLCGVPLDDSGHYFDPPWVQTNFSREVGTRTDGHMMYWHQARERLFRGRVTSMSGRTRTLLGEPKR